MLPGSGRVSSVRSAPRALHSRHRAGSRAPEVCAVCGTSEYAESMVPMLQDSVARVIDPAFKDKVHCADGLSSHDNCGAFRKGLA